MLGDLVPAAGEMAHLIGRTKDGERRPFDFALDAKLLVGVVEILYNGLRKQHDLASEFTGLAWHDLKEHSLYSSIMEQMEEYQADYDWQLPEFTPGLTMLRIAVRERLRTLLQEDGIDWTPDYIHDANPEDSYARASTT